MLMTLAIAGLIVWWPLTSARAQTATDLFQVSRISVDATAADAVAARNQAIQFGIFNRHSLDVVADAASRAAQAGDLRMANRLSHCFDSTLKAIEEAETYNLDKKQHVLGLIHALHAAMRS